MQVGMKEPMDVKVNIREKIASDYLLEQVDSLGLRNDPLFRDEYNGYLKKVVLNQYLSNELIIDLVDLDNEAKMYYEQHTKTFKEPKYMKVSLFEFDNLSNLHEAQEIIYKAYITENESILDDTTLLKGLINYQPGLTIKRDSTFLSTKNYDILLRLSPRTLSNEFEEDGKYYLIYKKQLSGEVLKPYNLVAEYIKYTIIENKREAAKQQLLTHLKNNYAIELNALQAIQNII